MKALIVNDTEQVLPEPFIHDWLTKTLGLMNQMKIMAPERQKPEVSLVFLKETEAKRLNWTYRGKDYATDILSFETEDPDSFGELVFCWSVLEKQAKEHKLSSENELGYLLIHGLLHLLGFDHEKPGADGEKMLQLQDEIFDKIRSSSNSKKTNAKKAKPTAAKKPAEATASQAKQSLKAKKSATKITAKSQTKPPPKKKMAASAVKKAKKKK